MSQLAALTNNPFLAKAMEAKTAVASPEVEKAHVIHPDMAVAEGRVFISFSLEELAKARPSKVKIDEKTGKETGGKNLVFGLAKTDFEVDGVWFTMGQGYHTFSPRK